MASKFIVSSPRTLRSASGRLPPSVLRTNSVSVTSFPVLSSPSAPALRSSFSRVYNTRIVVNQENESGVPDDGFCYQLCYDAFRQILELHSFQEAFYSLKDNLIQGLVQNLKYFSRKEPTVETGLAIAASIDFLKMFNESIPELEDIRRRALEGAMLLRKAQTSKFPKFHKGDVTKGTEILKTARDDIPKYI
ncbi:hypothetical protein F0562_015426 [Nyssa sinensis]|uniref:Uncharacterized protein n=1 Tax=Nyssa sinensis TaxID=561372 RepID=A0A5J4ZKD2_9ASTE|nr:hypothetical protein F0562_015426 [Nyssa sinensis]